MNHCTPQATVHSKNPHSFLNHIFRIFFAGCLFSALFVSIVVALDPQKAISQYTHRSWQTEEGLPQISVQCMTQTRDGYLWIGTQEGAIRFDGIKFTVFDRAHTQGLHHNSVRTILQTADGSLWLGTEGGLTRMQHGLFTTYTMDDGLANNTITDLFEDTQHNLWIGTHNGVSVLENGKFKTLTTKDGFLNNEITSLSGGQHGSIYIGTIAGLTKFSNGSITHYTTASGLADNNIRTVYFDSTHVLWVGTSSGLCQFKNGIWKTFTTKNGLINNRVRSICRDHDGNLWIGTNGGGLSRMTGSKISSYTTYDGLIDGYVSALFEDREGSFWVGTVGGGLHRFRNGSVVMYGEQEGLAQDNTRAIFESRDGTIWIGADIHGLTLFKNGRLNIFRGPAALANHGVRGIDEGPDGAMWIGTYGGGLYKFINGTFTSYTTKNGLINETLLCLTIASDSTLWCGTRGGVSRLKNGTWTSLTMNDGLASNVVRSMLQASDGTLWICTDGGLTAFKNGKLRTYTTENGLSYNMVYSVYEDEDNVLWIGTYGGGLNRLKNGQWTVYTTTHGLFDNAVFQILEDVYKNFWLTCNRGVYRVSRKELNDFADGTIREIHCTVFGTEDGMRSVKCNGTSQPAGIRAQDGTLWIPTMKGVAVLDPSKLDRASNPPPVFIEQILFGNRPLLGDTIVHLGPEEGELEIHYTALNYAAPKFLTFKYMLIGYDRDWVDAGTRRIAYYTNIPHGNYTFKVIACNNEGTWNFDGASIGVHIDSYFYQTNWFKSLSVVALLLIGLVVYHLRSISIRNREGELVRLIDDRTKNLQQEIAVRKRAEDELIKMQSVLLAAIDQSPAGIMLADAPDIKIRIVNKSAVDILMMSEEELMKISASNLNEITWQCFHPDGTPYAVQDLPLPQTIISGMSCSNIEMPVRRKDGSYRWILVNSSPIYGPDGKILGGIIVFPDITKRKLAEEALRESEENFRSLAEQSPNMIFINKRGRVVFANAKCEEIMGYSKEEFYAPDFNFQKITAPEFSSLLSEKYAHHQLGEEVLPYEYAVLTKKGKRIEVIIATKLIPYENERAILGIITDITERKKAEESLKQSLSLLQATLESTRDGILVVDNSGKISNYNAQFADMWNIPQNVLSSGDDKQAIDFVLNQLAHPEEFVAKVNYLYAHPEADSFDVLEFKDGRTFERYSHPQRIEGLPVGRVWSFRDVTEQRILQNQLLQSQKIQSIGTLAGGIAHDFNNILGIILGYSTLLERRKENPQKFAESVSAINQAVERGAALVQQILTFARKTDVAFQPVSLPEVCHELLTMLNQTFPRTIIFTETYAPNLPDVLADRTQIHQVLLNLCVNARDAMPTGGSIAIEVSHQTKSFVRDRFPAADQDSYIYIKVTDTGTGMDEITQLRIFDPFFTTKEKGKGTGLGLSVVYGVLQSHHGFIDVESQMGHGTTFTLALPVPHVPTMKLETELSEASTQVQGTETILLIEDESLLLDMLQTSLESEGYSIYKAPDGETAIQMYKQHEQTIALVVSDVGLPKMNGFDVFKKLKEIDPDIKVILASGFFEPKVKMTLQHDGVRGFIQKPYVPQEILQKIRNVLDEPDA